MRVRFWGVRGSFPVPGPTTMRYGGNTSCVEVRLEDPQAPRIILDAGTGLRRLGKEMMQEAFGRGAGEAHLLVTHTHWDHIQGLPFFAPLYQRGNRFHVYARQRNDTHLRAIFATQTENPYFSVPFDAAAAHVQFTELSDHAAFEIGPVRVRCTRLNHPWIAIAYRLDYEGRSLAYVTDTAPFRDILIEQQFISQPPRPGEPLPPGDAAKLAAMRQGVVALCEGADLVIYDTQFTPEEYATRPHWGHSCPEDAIEIAAEAGAHALVLFHHAPERTDSQIDALLQQHRAEVARRKLPLVLYAAAEGLELVVGAQQDVPAQVMAR
ncbi:MAG: MBL fold metallo-hydrolase [Myxococcales bacterium]|nr:MBL fold metallo-hydrolase [Myxococcota bacterium]MDW8281388.1 MBL fold metallo-hydrolase [Myxococcales bacterium]